MKDEEYVRAHWERVEWRGSYEHGDGLEVGGKRFTVPNSAGNPELYLLPTQALEIWAAAAEFTRERLEQIRQLEREISLIAAWHEDEREDAEWRMTVKATASTTISSSLAGIDARNTVTLSRILARLESALADLRKGMKA